MNSVRVRFAPSPTGALHIGGIRTALYNYLFARKNKGTFILRIEDTDQNRYVPGAEQYIIDALNWVGLKPDEGPNIGGSFGPYRQSERKSIYKSYADELVNRGHAYYAFDTPEQLEQYRSLDPEFKYCGKTRLSLNNSLTASEELVKRHISEQNYVIRLKIPEDETVVFEDIVRGQVTFSTNELDDKVILKGDGMPTYHLANIVDDHLMEISHVIRGEEWLSSTPHHLLMYKFLGWNNPEFAHLPLILKPNGKGKLSKRDGANFGFPVFPLSWKSENEENNFVGFKEDGYLPETLINFLALLGWSPGDDREMWSIQELEQVFSLERIVKSGARFDIDKALWYNQQYLINADNSEIAKTLLSISSEVEVSTEYLEKVCGLMKERVHKITEIWTKGSFFFEAPTLYDEQTIKNKYRDELGIHIKKMIDIIENSAWIDLEKNIKSYIVDQGLKLGEVMPLLRVGICGTMQGPDLFQTIQTLGQKEAAKRLDKAILIFEKTINS